MQVDPGFERNAELMERAAGRQQESRGDKDRFLRVINGLVDQLKGTNPQSQFIKSLDSARRKIEASCISCEVLPDVFGLVNSDAGFRKVMDLLSANTDFMGLLRKFDGITDKAGNHPYHLVRDFGSIQEKNQLLAFLENLVAIRDKVGHQGTEESLGALKKARASGQISEASYAAGMGAVNAAADYMKSCSIDLLKLIGPRFSKGGAQEAISASFRSTSANEVLTVAFGYGEAQKSKSSARAQRQFEELQDELNRLAAQALREVPASMPSGQRAELRKIALSRIEETVPISV